MIAERKTRANVGVGIGAVLQLAGLYLIRNGPTDAVLGLLLLLASIPIFLWGCMNYAAGKGHSQWVGLAGLAGIIGLIVLILLPDQSHNGSVARQQLRKWIGVIFLVIGFGTAMLGRWFHQLGEDPRLERLLGRWIPVSVLLGTFVVFISLALMVGVSSQCRAEAPEPSEESARSAGNRTPRSTGPGGG